MQALVCAHGERRMDMADLCQGRFAVQIFIAVPPARRYPPCGGRVADAKFGQFVNDRHSAQIFLFGQFIAKANTVIIDPERQNHPAFQTIGYGHAQFIIMVADIFFLTPGLGPCFIKRCFGKAGMGKTAVQMGGILKPQAKSGFFDHCLAVAAHLIIGDLPLKAHGDRQDISR